MRADDYGPRRDNHREMRNAPEIRLFRSPSEDDVDVDIGSPPRITMEGGRCKDDEVVKLLARQYDSPTNRADVGRSRSAIRQRKIVDSRVSSCSTIFQRPRPFGQRGTFRNSL